MSFAAHIKKELVGIDSKPCCQLAELSALFKMNGTMSLTSSGPILSFDTENAAIARRVLTLLKQNFPDVQTSILARKKKNLKKNNTYVVKVISHVLTVANQLQVMPSDTGDFSLFETLLIKNCCPRAYLRGAFLAGGSINNPETSSYHFELTTSDPEHARTLQLILNDLDLNARVLARKKGQICYIKEAEKIGDFLRAVGAVGSVLNFEDMRIIRDIRNSDNRLNNCEIANETKTLTAADQQVQDIEFIRRQKGTDFLNDKLSYVANLRLEFPEENLAYLAEIATERGNPLTKSGINHRMRNIKKMATELRGER
ncbi:MAG: DNA-binding protein WhiA [Defluviitaleaceae bacterium]|nr:DNA-binding protein WhiA [Defluviitaleaceae bacterium]